MALSATPSDFRTQDLACQASTVSDIAYADDLVSVVASPEILQAKADVMSAWCLLSNVKMNTSKFRTFGILGEAGRDSTEQLIIHGEQWEEIVVSINHDGLMTHLGVMWNMGINNEKQLESLKEKLEIIGSRILRHKGRVGDKLMALEY